MVSNLFLKCTNVFGVNSMFGDTPIRRLFSAQNKSNCIIFEIVLLQTTHSRRWKWLADEEETPENACLQVHAVYRRMHFLFGAYFFWARIPGVFLTLLTRPSYLFMLEAPVFHWLATPTRAAFMLTYYHVDLLCFFCTPNCRWNSLSCQSHVICFFFSAVGYNVIA